MSGAPRQNPLFWLLGVAMTSLTVGILQAKVNLIGEWLPWWAFLAIMAIGLPVIAFRFSNQIRQSVRDLFDFLELSLRRSDVIKSEDFPRIMKHYLKGMPRDGGIISFYNVPLATLQEEESRKQLWVNAIGLNPRVKQFRLFLPNEKLDDLRRGLLLIRQDYPDEGLSIMEKLGKKIAVVVVKCPPEELLNFACMLEDDYRKRPVFCSTTIMAPPFWDGKKFSHFFAFRGTSRQSGDVCNLIRDHIKLLWDATLRDLPKNVPFDYPATASNEISRKLTVTVESLIPTGTLLARLGIVHENS